MYFAHIDRISRSRLTLNRDRAYATLRRMLALSPSHTVLDVDSGDGFWTARFATHCAHITGLEPDRRMLGYARTLHQRSNVIYVCGVSE
jgi:2-polyprenyl-3-methyl-5-hydroxy-6-metoxy-1,4-benzoquinol methylase